MPPEILLYALADIIVLFMLVAIALRPAEEAPRVQTPVDDDDGRTWLTVPCWLI